MIDKVDKDQCSGCGACVSACPFDCISMKADSEGFLYPELNTSKCVNCGICVASCQCLTPLKADPLPEAYACFNKDQNTQLSSSSGGIFTLLAQWILSKDGVVFGAGFDESFQVKHIEVHTSNELYRLRGSKYVQSCIGDCYERVKQYLDENKYVLFTGTPCQIDGLLHVLKHPYERLYTQDIICHGVPSPKVWKEYIEFRKSTKGMMELKKDGEPSFRDKKNGWLDFSMRFLFEDGSEYNVGHQHDLYMKIYLQNISLRLSCYQCHSKSIHRNSDITLADFWGIQNVKPDMYNEMGTSLVMVNSEKGQELFNQVSPQMAFCKVDMDQALYYNPSVHTSVELSHPRQRKVLFKKLGKKRFDQLVDEATRVTIFDRINFHIRRFVKFVKR